MWLFASYPPPPTGEKKHGMGRRVLQSTATNAYKIGGSDQACHLLFHFAVKQRRTGETEFFVEATDGTDFSSFFRFPPSLPI